jgi:2-methylcitrate dehydratase PrpD
VLREVTGITIETYGPGYEIVKETNPRTPYQAKFSLAYCVTTALLEGALGLEQFGEERFGPDGVREAATSDVLGRVKVTVSDDLTAQYPSAWPVRVTIFLDSGATERAASEYPRGNAENPVSTDELERKFTTLVAARFGGDVARSALAALHSMDRCSDMATLFSSTGRLKPAPTYREPIGAPLA